MGMELANGYGNTPAIGRSALGWTRVGRWCVLGWRVFRQAPVRIWLLALVPILFEALMQLMPTVGIGLSKLLTPAVSAWVLIMLDCRVRGHGFAPGAAGRKAVVRWRQVAGLALAGVAVFAVQLSTTALVGGQAQAIALASGDIAGMGYSKAGMAGILASGMIPMLLLFFVAPRMMLDGLRLGPAIAENARLLLRCWRPVLLYSAMMAVVLAGLLWLPLMLLLLLPAGLCIAYAAYRDIFDPVPEA